MASTSGQLQRSCAAAALVAVACCGIAVAAPAPELLQPLAPLQFDPAVRGYAPAYPYGAVAQAAPAVAVQVGSAVRTLQYLDSPAVVGYAPSVSYKPDLSAYAAASFPQVEQLSRFNPGYRPVHTVVPKVTAVEPSVAVQKTYVDVPVLHHEVRPQVVDPSYYAYQLVNRK